MKKTVLLADDHPLFRKGIIELLRSEAPKFEYLEAKNGFEVIDTVRNQRIDIVMLDINMPQLDGVGTARILHKENPETKVIVLSQYDDLALVNHMLSNGAESYLLKTSEPCEIIEAIEMALNNDIYINELMRVALLCSNIDALKLTDVEIQIIQLLADGKPSKVIGSTLGLSEHTIETYRKRLLVKTNVKNTAELISFAYKNAIIK